MTPVDNTLRAIDHGQCVLRFGQGQQLGQWLPNAEHIRQLADSQQSSARGDQVGGGSEINHTVGIQWQHHKC